MGSGEAVQLKLLTFTRWSCLDGKTTAQTNMPAPPSCLIDKQQHHSSHHKRAASTHQHHRAFHKTTCPLQESQKKAAYTDRRRHAVPEYSHFPTISLSAGDVDAAGEVCERL